MWEIHCSQERARALPDTDVVRSQMSTDADVERARRLVQSPGRATMPMLRENDRRATNGACVTGARLVRPAGRPWTTKPLRLGLGPAAGAMRCDAPVPCTVVCRRQQHLSSLVGSVGAPERPRDCCQGSVVVVIWLILPVVICLSQRLSHACLSISTCTVKLRMAH